MRLDRRHRGAACLPLLLLLATPSGAADLPHPRRAAQHRVAVRSASPRVAVILPAAATMAPEVGAARAPLPSPTSLLLPGATGVPAFVDLTPVFAAQRACGPGFSPDALQACRRHGELRVDCDPSGHGCIPLPPDPLPYGLGAAARLAY